MIVYTALGDQNDVTQKIFLIELVGLIDHVTKQAQCKLNRKCSLKTKWHLNISKKYKAN